MIHEYVAQAPEQESGAHALFFSSIEYVVLGINVATVLVLAWGVLYGFVRFLHVEHARLTGGSCKDETHQLRRQVGFYLLFGLELLIAADVIETMLRPTLDQLAILAGVSAIRIVTGYALGRELHEIKKADCDD